MVRKSQKKKDADAPLASPFAIQPIQMTDCQVKGLTLPSGKFEYCDGALWYPLASETYVDGKVFDINTNTSAQLNISRLNGYPNSSNAFLRGDGTWILPYINTLNINGTVSLSTYGLTTSGNLNATTGTLIANNLQAYNSGSLVVQSPLSLSNIGSTPINITSNTLQTRINFNNTNTAASATGLVIQNNGADAVEFGFNNSTNEAYVWATGAATLKFGTNAIKRMELLNNGSLVMYDNPTYALSGTYGYLNSSGSTGTATSSGYYSISCPNRIKASEFNAYSSE